MSNMTKLMLAAAILLCACRTDAGAEEHAASADAEPPTMTTAAELIPIGDISWFTDYDAAVATARAEDKPLWVHFGEDPG